MGELILATSAIKHFSMVGKINEPFIMKQVCIKEGASTNERDEFKKKVKEANGKLIYIAREYDGTERYWLCYKGKLEESKLSQSKEIIYL